MGEAVDTVTDLRRRGPVKEMQAPETAAGRHVIPPATWTKAQAGINNGFPQAVAHRGYKANYPENTMGAFRGAVEVGAHAVETDLHLSRDGVVVLSHDKDLKRCFGQEALVRDSDWEYLSTLETLREPRQPMPRLLDLLEYLAEPKNEAVWAFLDIKLDDTPEDIIPRIAETVAAAPEGNWKQRLVLGCWTAKHLRLCHEVLPDFAVAHIGGPIARARYFLGVPNVVMNLRQELVFGFGGPALRKRCRDEGRPLYVWTVNKESWMKWCIEQKTDCVITDNPKHYLEVCARHEAEPAGPDSRPVAIAKELRDFLVSVVWLIVAAVLMRVLRVSQRLGRPSEIQEELRKV